jgi:hypothetical protein
MFESFSNLCPAAEIGCGPEDPGWWTLRSVLADVPALVLIGHWLQGCCDSVDLLAMVASTERDDRRMLRWEKCLRSQMSCHPSHPSSFIRPAWYRIASHPPTLYTVPSVAHRGGVVDVWSLLIEIGPAPLSYRSKLAPPNQKPAASHQPSLSAPCLPPSTASHPMPY